MFFQDSEAHSTSTDDQQFQSRKEIRNNITQSVTSLSTSTFAEIQQVAAVFKQCMVRKYSRARFAGSMLS